MTTCAEARLKRRERRARQVAKSDLENMLAGNVVLLSRGFVARSCW
jgi:hypothetical protein